MKSLMFVLSFLASGAVLATNPPPAGTNTNTNTNTVTGTNTNNNTLTGGTGGQGGQGGKGGEGGKGYGGTGIGVGVGIGKGGKGGSARSEATGGQATGGKAEATGGKADASNGGVVLSVSDSEVLQRHNTPSLGSIIIAPTANCQVVHGGGVSVPGFGINVGTSTTNAVCELIELSKQLGSLGLKEGATQIMCQDSRVAKALGHVCHHSKAVEVETTKEVFVQEKIGS